VFNPNLKPLQVETQLLALRLVLPASSPKPFVLAGGIEMLGDVVRAHPGREGVCSGAARTLQMLASLNDITRGTYIYDYLYVCMYIYIYIYIYMCVCVCVSVIDLYIYV